MRHRVSAGLACALSLVGSSALAFAESSAAINSIQFQLIDLAPQDGPASFQYSGGKTTLLVSTTDGGGDADSMSKTRSGTFAFSDEFASQLEHVSSTAVIALDRLNVSGSASGLGQTYSSYSSRVTTGIDSSYPYYNSTGNLTLSARSMLVITAEASVFASATNPAPASCYYCSSTENAGAAASMTLNYSYGGGNTSASYSFNDAVGVNATARGAYQSQEFAGYRQVPYTYGGYTYYYSEPIYNTVTHPLVEETKSASKYLTAVFMNTSDSAVSANLYFSVSTAGTANTAAAVLPGSVSAVPEADAAALWLAGLGVVGGVAARRRVRRVA